MIENTTYVRASRAAVRQVIARAAAQTQVSDALLTRVGMTALGRIKRAFVVKSRGGTDEAGDRWQPLSPRTVAYSKTRQRGRGGRTRAEKKRDTFPSQALTKKQADRWWDLYRQGLVIFKGGKGSAAKHAWSISKREGATTLLSKYGYRQVEILRDTGLLLNSLSPGVASTERVFRTGRGVVIVGTNRRGAAAHHSGIPGRLPQRRLWPDPKDWPPAWWAEILEQAKQGVLDVITRLLRNI